MRASYPDTHISVSKDVRTRGFFFEAKREAESKTVWEHCSDIRLLHTTLRDPGLLWSSVLRFTIHVAKDSKKRKFYQ